MNSTTEILPPSPLESTPEDHGETRGAAKQAGLAILFYALFQVCLPLIRIPAVRLPIIVQLLLIVIPTMAFMFLQVRLALCIIRLRLSRLPAILLGWVSLKIWWMTFLISPRLHHGAPLPMAIGYELLRHTMQDLTVTLACTFAGIVLSAIVKDKNTLLPVAFIAMPIDYLGAMTPIGFTNNMIKAHPGIVKAVAVSVPKLSGPGGISLSPIGLIGPGDALFMAFYFAVVLRLSLNIKRTFWWMYWLLSASLIAVLIIPSFFALAALVPMGIAVIAANGSRFSLTRAEWFAFLYAGILVLFLAVGFYLYSHTQLMGGH